MTKCAALKSRAPASESQNFADRTHRGSTLARDYQLVAKLAPPGR
jgi:hypothetical protein